MKKLICLLLCFGMILSCLPAVAEGGADGEALVRELIDAQLKKQKDSWVITILEAGARDITVEDGKLNFSLCPFNPNPAALGAYAKADDPAAWREAMLAAACDYSLKISLKLQDNGTVGSKAADSFSNTVRKAASDARNNFNKKDCQKALEDLVFPLPAKTKRTSGEELTPVSETFAAFIAAHPDIFPDGNADVWAPLLYGQREVSFSFKNGPRSIQVKWEGISPENLVTGAYDATIAELSGVYADQRAERSAVPALFQRKLADISIKLVKGKREKLSTTVDVTELAAGKLPAEYAAYVARYDLKGSLQRLADEYDLIPEDASVKMPKTGTVSVPGNNGRAITVRVDQNGRNTYFQLRDADTGVILADGFIRPGESVNTKVREGSCIIQYASGAAWYGVDGLFGSLGEYQASDPFIVGKQKWKLNAPAGQEGIVLHQAAASDFMNVDDKSVKIKGQLKASVSIGKYAENNPVIEGVSSTTGLPASGETYTPILVVLDNAEDAYPHWGVSQADIIFQIPNAGSGATKLMGLFADHYPEQAGPVRSARATMLPAAKALNAVFIHRGRPPFAAGQAPNANVDTLVGQWKLSHIDIGVDHFGERVNGLPNSHNLSAHISEIHEDLLKKGTSFEERPFLFTDEARTTGAAANNIRILHRGEDSGTAPNSPSTATFNYEAKLGGYTRTNTSGLYTDRTTGETVVFANLIVLRVKNGWDEGYAFLNSHMTGEGCAEIFQNGHYVQGAWKRDSLNSRLILIDEDGSELQMQRGKTFIVITNDVTDVIYSE